MRGPALLFGLICGCAVAVPGASASPGDSSGWIRPRADVDTPARGLAGLQSALQVRVGDSTTTATTDERDEGEEEDHHAVPASVAHLISVGTGSAKRRLQQLNPRRAYYSHGGAMGEAPTMLSDPKWKRILRQVDPTAYRETFSEERDAGGYMKAMENNPVMAAFAYDRMRADDPDNPRLYQPFEIDCFFHPDATAARPMVDEMLVAHGIGAKHLRREAKGENTYHDVAGIKVTEFGGVTLSKWRRSFTRALRLARGESDIEGPVDWETFYAAYHHGVTQRKAFKVVLDVKTGGADGEFIKAVIRDLNRHDVLVDAVGSFSDAQIIGQGIEDIDQRAHGERVSAKPILFFHGLYGWGVFGEKELLNRCYHDRLQGVKYVMFNLGFLLEYPVTRFGLPAKGSYKDTRMSVSTKDLDRLRECVDKHGVQIGGYVQEYDINIQALRLISGAVNRLPDLFPLGFAWGGFVNRWYRSMKSTAWDTMTGTATQSFIGKRRIIRALNMDRVSGGKEVHDYATRLSGEKEEEEEELI